MPRSPRAAVVVLVGIGIVVGAAHGCSGLSGCNGIFSTSHDPTQIVGEHTTLDVNKVAAFKQQVTWQRSETNGVHHLFVHFVPTEGVWRPGETLTFQIRLKQPCDSWRFSGGFEDTIDTRISGPKTNTTEINVSTQASPKPGEDVVIDVQAGVPPVIDQVAMVPREPDPASQ